MEAWGWLCEGIVILSGLQGREYGTEEVVCKMLMHKEDPQLCSQNSQEQARCGSVHLYHHMVGVAGGRGIGRVPWAYWSASLPDLVLSRPVRETLSQKEGSGGSRHSTWRVYKHEHINTFLTCTNPLHTHIEYESGRGLSHLRLECEPDIVAHLIL